jgi:hypothetical protein
VPVVERAGAAYIHGMQLRRSACPTLIVACLAASACSDPPASDDGTTTAPASDDTSSATPPSTSTAADGGSSSSGSTGGTSSSSGSSEGSSSSGGPPVLLDVGPETGGVEGCATDAPDVIFVMLPTTPTEIWSYDPVRNEFDPFTTVECDEVEGYYTGFGLERDGHVVLLSLEPEDPAVLPYPAMQLTRVDPTSGACEVVYYGAMANGPFGVDCADLAFVSQPGDAEHERLFAHACTGGGFTVVPGSGIGPLFRTDLADMDPAFDLLDADDYTSVALAGTGDGRLYGVGGDQKLPGVAQIIEYDQDDGAILSSETVPALDIGDQGAYIALAFYAGDLYTFGLDTSDFSLTIRRYDLDDDDGNGVHDVTEIETPASAPGGVIAAASPTCIPLTPAG